MRKVLVTGGAGFIGCNLVRFLLEKEQQVVVLDNLSTGKLENLAEIEGDFEMVEGDIRDQETVKRAAAGTEVVFHLAALGSVPRSVENPRLTHDVNVNGTLALLEAARSVGAQRVVFAASSSAYGDQAVSPKHESMTPKPISPYAASKISGEAYMQGYAAVYGMQTLCLRYFNVFGPWQDPNSTYAAVIPSFVSRLLSGNRPCIFGDGEQSRDFCYIRNVCEANWLAAEARSQNCRGQPLNIACGRQTSLNQLLTHIQNCLSTRVDPEYCAARRGDVRDSLADIRLARDTIGYEPLVHIEEGLRQAVQWYTER